MDRAVLVLAVLLPVLMGAAFILGRHLNRRQVLADHLSPVSRQHIHLSQGGQLNPSVVESAKVRFRALLERGDWQSVEAQLRPGMHYVVQVRALAELGTDEAGHILERQLQRRLTTDRFEQSWYWIDLAHGLRILKREQSLPHLLRCSEAAAPLPLGHFFAAETVCFLGFGGYLSRSDGPLQQAALRTLHRAMEGLRYGVHAQVFAEARLGEAVESLWDNRSGQPLPLVVRIFVEARRHLRRVPIAESALADDPADLETYRWQLARLGSLEPLLDDYLAEAPDPLRAGLGAAPVDQQPDFLNALQDLRAEAATQILGLLADPQFPHAELAIHVLRWSRDSAVGPRLREMAARQLPILARSTRGRLASILRGQPADAGVPYAAILFALRGHASRETEMFLVLASRDRDPELRAAAVSSLGWWEPIHRGQVEHTLQQRRRDPSSQVRVAARAALARLGERQALHAFRIALSSEDVDRVHETIQIIANEGLTLLWPDLDRLVDVDDVDVAQHAREVLAVMSEDLERGCT
jgi:hypothetical protein